MTLEEVHTILESAQRYMTNNRNEEFDKLIKLNGMLILRCEKLLEEKARGKMNKQNCWGICRETERLEKELYIYQKALEMACEELETHPYSQWNADEWFNYFVQKVREENE